MFSLILFLLLPLFTLQQVMDATTQLQYEELKQEVRRMLAKTMDKPSQKLHLIDAVQRLGVAYHFEKETEEALKNIYHDCNDIESDDLYTIAVRFRLLREHGFNVHCGIYIYMRLNLLKVLPIFINAPISLKKPEL